MVKREKLEKFKRNEKLIRALNVLVAGGAMAGFVICPILPIAMYPFLKLGSKIREDREHERLINSLSKQGLISIENDKVKITEKGSSWLNFQTINDLNIEKSSAWDKFWRVVMFDIPEERRRSRDYFRRFLQRVGFRKLQESVFIFPYPCEKQVREAAEVLGIWEYVNLMRVDKIDKEEELRQLFEL